MLKGKPIGSRWPIPYYVVQDYEPVTYIHAGTFHLYPRDVKHDDGNTIFDTYMCVEINQNKYKSNFMTGALGDVITRGKHGISTFRPHDKGGSVGLLGRRHLIAAACAYIKTYYQQIGFSDLTKDRFTPISTLFENPSLPGWSLKNLGDWLLETATDGSMVVANSPSLFILTKQPDLMPKAIVR